MKWGTTPTSVATISIVDVFHDIILSAKTLARAGVFALVGSCAVVLGTARAEFGVRHVVQNSWLNPDLFSENAEFPKFWKKLLTI